MARKAKAKKLNVKVGDKVKIVFNGSGHNIPTDTVVTVSHVTGNTYGDIHVISPITGSQVIIYAGDFELIPQTIEEMEKSIAELKAEVKVLDNKIAFMKANDLKEYDETQFKAFSVLQLLKENMTDIEKAKIIANLIDN